MNGKDETEEAHRQHHFVSLILKLCPISALQKWLHRFQRSGAALVLA